MFRRYLITASIMLAASLAAGCAAPEEPGDGGTLTDTNGRPSSMVTQEGWEELEVFSGGATIKLDPLGHFHTSWNPCYQEAWGAVSLDTWNQIAANLNTLLKTAPGEKEECFDISETYAPEDPKGCHALSYYVKAKRSNGTITVMDTDRVKVCTKYSNLPAAKKFLQGVNSMLLTAATEECRNADPKRYCGH